jgi:UDP:flavonoid glycosyltransferase YjiC (YdhE family)
MFGDQDLNMQKSEANGFAVTLKYNDLTENDVVGAINRVVNEPK